MRDGTPFLRRRIASPPTGSVRPDRPGSPAKICYSAPPTPPIGPGGPIIRIGAKMAVIRRRIARRAVSSHTHRRPALLERARRGRRKPSRDPHRLRAAGRPHGALQMGQHDARQHQERDHRNLPQARPRSCPTLPRQLRVRSRSIYRMEKIGLNIKAHKQTPVSDLDLGAFERLSANQPRLRRRRGSRHRDTGWDVGDDFH